MRAAMKAVMRDDMEQLEEVVWSSCASSYEKVIRKRDEKSDF